MHGRRPIKENNMAKEKIALMIDGKEEKFERDFKKMPLNLEDYFASLVFTNWVSKITRLDSQGQTTEKDIRGYAEAQIKFIVSFFRNQFTYDDCKKGLNPAVLQAMLPKWSDMASGLLTGEKDPKK